MSSPERRELQDSCDGEIYWVRFALHTLHGERHNTAITAQWVWAIRKTAMAHLPTGIKLGTTLKHKSECLRWQTLRKRVSVRERGRRERWRERRRERERCAWLSLHAVQSCGDFHSSSRTGEMFIKKRYSHLSWGICHWRTDKTFYFSANDILFSFPSFFFTVHFPSWK